MFYVGESVLVFWLFFFLGFLLNFLFLLSWLFLLLLFFLLLRDWLLFCLTFLLNFVFLLLFRHLHLLLFCFFLFLTKMLLQRRPLNISAPIILPTAPTSFLFLFPLPPFLLSLMNIAIDINSRLIPLLLHCRILSSFQKRFISLLFIIFINFGDISFYLFEEGVFGWLVVYFVLFVFICIFWFFIKNTV